MKSKDSNLSFRLTVLAIIILSFVSCATSVNAEKVPVDKEYISLLSGETTPKEITESGKIIINYKLNMPIKDEEECIIKYEIITDTLKIASPWLKDIKMGSITLSQPQPIADLKKEGQLEVLIINKLPFDIQDGSLVMSGAGQYYFKFIGDSKLNIYITVKNKRISNVLVVPVTFKSYADNTQDLISAADKGDISTVQALLAKSVDVNAKDNDGMTALMVASFNGNLDVAQALLSKGADVNAKTNAGETALMWASSYGHLEIMQALLSKGADVNAKTNAGETALMVTSHRGHLDIAQVLLSKGADVNAKDNAGKTALSLAKEKGHNDVVQLLIKAGAKE